MNWQFMFRFSACFNAYWHFQLLFTFQKRYFFSLHAHSNNSANFWIVVETTKKRASHLITNEPKAHALRQSPHYCTFKQEEARKRKEQKVLFSNSYIEDITRWREDMNFMFSWQEQYLTHSLRSLVRYCSCHSNIKFINFFLKHLSGPDS